MNTALIPSGKNKQTDKKNPHCNSHQITWKKEDKEDITNICGCDERASSL